MSKIMIVTQKRSVLNSILTFMRCVYTHHIALTGPIVNEKRNSLDYDTGSFPPWFLLLLTWQCTFLTFAQFIIDIVVLFIGSMCSNLRSRFCSKIYAQKWSSSYRLWLLVCQIVTHSAVITSYIFFPLCEFHCWWWWRKKTHKSKQHKIWRA